jgi:class 3 adenylate cyclase
MKIIGRYLFVVALATGIWISAKAQPHAGATRIAEMQQQLAGHVSDSEEVNLLNEISFTYNKINPYEGIRYATRSLALATDMNWKFGIARANSCLGANYYSLSDYPNAYNYWLKALSIHEKLGNKKGIANHLHNIGNIYLSQKKYKEALEYYENGLKTSKDAADKNLVTHSYSAIGNVYTQLKNYSKALEYHFDALAIDESTNNKGNISSDLMNIGFVYNEQGDYPKALDILFKALRIKNETGDKNGLAKVYNTIGNVYLNMAKADAGQTNNLHNAITYLDSAVATGTEIGYLDNLQKSYENLSTAYRIGGDYKSALHYTDSYHTIKDSVYSLENNEQIVKQGLKFEFEKTRISDKLKLNRQQIYTYSGFVCIVLLAGFSFFIVKERRKSEKLLLNILPSDIAEELKTKGVTKARYYNDVTVLFTDFVNFTSSSEHMEPQLLIDELHACFKAFDEIMGKYKIEKIKTIGDAYLAVAGLPAANAQHAECIVKAAIEISRFMTDRRARLGDKTFEMRAGIHSGSVVAGIVGVTKFAYDIWGDTVNTAARMEQNSIAGRINISETTYELVKDKFICSHRGAIPAKNKGEMNMYFVEEAINA